MKTSAWLRRAGLLVAALALLASSVWTVQQDETGLVHRFGKVVRQVEPGIHLTLPWPCERIVKVKTAISRTMPVGFTFMEQLGVESMDPTLREWLTGDTNIVKMEVTLYYTISDARQYLYGMSDLPDGSARDLALRKLAEGVMTESIAGMGIDEVLSTGKTQLRNEVLERVQAQADALRLGITLTAFNLTEVGPPPEAQNAFNEVTSAKSYRDQQISEAQGMRLTVLPFARSEADRIVQLAEGERSEILGRARGWVSSFHALAASLQEHRALGMQRLWLQTIEGLLGSRPVQVLPRVPAGTSLPLYLQD